MRGASCSHIDPERRASRFAASLPSTVQAGCEDDAGTTFYPAHDGLGAEPLAARRIVRRAGTDSVEMCRLRHLATVSIELRCARTADRPWRRFAPP